MPGFTSYDAVGNAEDVQDEIYDISPADNPVCSMSMTIPATARVHEWQEDELADIRKSAAVEGADAGSDTSSATSLKTNNCQIFEEVARITGTQEEVNKYGRASEMAYQLRKRYLQMAKNEEASCVGAPGGTRQTGVVGDNSTARELASIYSQADASVITDAVGAADVAALEDLMVANHLAVYNEGGNPSYAVTDPGTAGYFPEFARSAGRNRDIMETDLINAVDLYVSQYGQLDVVLNRSMIQTNEAILLMDFDYSATPVLRPTFDYELAKSGDAENRQVIRESTYALLNSKACGIVDNVPNGLT